MHRYTKRLLKSIVAIPTVSIGSWVAYEYFTAPPQIRPSDYCNFTPSIDRSGNLNKLQNEHFDILVVGGGASGCSVAMDAASRGLRVALVERDDWASGTSSRSTKLLHGGVRYLKDAIYNADFEMFKLVYDALRERSHMLHVSPFMTRPIAILMPMFEYREILKFWTGLKMYEFIAQIATLGNTNLPSSYLMTKENSLHAFPLLKPEGLVASMLYYDGQQNDSRVALSIALTAAIDGYLEGWKGATILNHCEVDSFSFGDDGKISGANCTDKISGEKIKISSTSVINCTGPFADALRSQGNSDAPKLVQPAAGAHLILPKSYSAPSVGFMIPETTDGRVLFYLPWENNTICGTTDIKVDALSSLPPPPTSQEIDFIIKESVKYLCLEESDISADISSAWTGYRPLVLDPKTVGSDTSKLSRDHEVVLCSESGLISLIGGKWTTCRKMAEDAVDQAIVHHTLKPKYRKSRTYGLVFMDSHDYLNVFPQAQTDVHKNSLHSRLSMFISKTYGVELDDAAHLSRSYGYKAIELCETVKKKMLSPIIPNQPFLRAEIIWAVRKEMAMSLTDVIGNRMRMCFVDTESTRAVLDEVLEIMARELGWDDTRIRSEREAGVAFIESMTLQGRAELDGVRSKFIRKRTYRDISV